MATGPATPGGAGNGAPNPSKPAIPAKPAAAPAGIPPRGTSAARPPVGPPAAKAPATGAVPARPATSAGPARAPVAPPRPQSAAPGAARAPVGPPAAKPASAALPAKPASTVQPAGGVPNIPRNSGVRAVPPIAQTPRQTSTRLPTAGSSPAGPSGVQSDRAKLGLGSLKPSEMIEGLDEVAKRLEKQQEREAAKQKSGGKISQNEALKTDDTGKRWQRNVILGLIGITVLGAAAFIFMMITANLQTIDPRKGNAATRGMMMKLIGFAQRIPVDEHDSLSTDSVVAKLREQVEAQYKQVEADIGRDKERRDREGKHRPPDTRLYRELEELGELKKFKDPWGQPLEFDFRDGILTIRGKGSSKGDSIEPVTTPLGKKAEKPAAK